jgi:DNA-binding NarL/FixJ family response regulator
MFFVNPMTGDEKYLTSEDTSISSFSLLEFKKLFIEGELKFLLACLAKGFNPSFIIVSQSNLEAALAFKSIKRTNDFLGAATSSSQAIDLLTKLSPGFIFIHERIEVPQYANLAKYASQLSPSTKVFVLIDSLALIEKYDVNDVDVFIADSDIFLPVNPLAQGCMAMIAGTTYRSPSVTRYINELPLPMEQHTSRHISLSLRDQQLLEAYVLGLSNREVAESLKLSVRTIQTYSGQLLARLGVNNRQKALVRIAQLGISVIPKFFTGESR